MSKLEDLLNKLCSDGVEFIKLDNCLSYEQPTKYIVKCKVGLMQRPERVVLTAFGAIMCGIMADVMWLAVPIAIIAVLANITAFWRIGHCYNVLKGKK